MILHSDGVTIRKPHRCWGCGYVNQPGTLMMVSVSSEDRRMVSGYWCEVCQEATSIGDYRGDDMVGECDVLLGDEGAWWQAAHSLMETEMARS